jgi:hypothetical protein
MRRFHILKWNRSRAYLLAKRRNPDQQPEELGLPTRSFVLGLFTNIAALESAPRFPLCHRFDGYWHELETGHFTCYQNRIFSVAKNIMYLRGDKRPGR